MILDIDTISQVERRNRIDRLCELTDHPSRACLRALRLSGWDVDKASTLLDSEGRRAHLSPLQIDALKDWVRAEILLNGNGRWDGVGVVHMLAEARLDVALGD